jgi:hypothetical protein
MPTDNRCESLDSVINHGPQDDRELIGKDSPQTNTKSEIQNSRSKSVTFMIELLLYLATGIVLISTASDPKSLLMKLFMTSAVLVILTKSSHHCSHYLYMTASMALFCLSLFSSHLLTPRMAAISGHPRSQTTLIQCICAVAILCLPAVWFKNAFKRLLPIASLVISLTYLGKLTSELGISNNEAFTGCRHISLMTASADCFQASRYLNQTSEILVFWPAVLACCFALANSLKSSNDASRSSTMRGKSRKSALIIAAILILMVALPLSRMPTVAPDALQYFGTPALKLCSALNNRRGIISIKPVTSRKTAAVSSLLTIRLGGFDLSQADIEFDHSVYIAARTSTTITLHTATPDLQVSAKFPGYYIRSQQVDARKDIKINMDLEAIQDEKEERIESAGLTLIKDDGSKCTVNLQNLYCPTARFDPDTLTVYYKPDKRWTIAEQEKHKETPSRRRLQGVQEEPAFARVSVQARVQRFVDSENEVFTFIFVPNHGPILVKSDDYGVATQVHVQQFATADRVASFFAERQSSDKIGVAIFATGSSLAIQASDWEQIQQIPPETIQESELSIMKMSFEHGISVDNTYSLIEKTAFYISNTESLNKRIDETRNNGFSILLPEALCLECFKWVYKPLASQIAIDEEHEKLEMVLLNVEKFYSLVGKSGNYTGIFDHLESNGGKKFEALGLGFNEILFSRYVEEHSWLLSRDLMIDVRSHELAFVRDVEEMYLLAKNGFMFALTKEELERLADAYQKNKYLNEPFANPELAYAEDADEFIERPYFMYKKQRYQVDLDAILKFIEDPTREPEFTYTMDSSVFKPSFLNQIFTIPRNCLKTIFNHYHSLFVDSRQTPADYVWPTVDLFIKGHTKRFTINLSHLLYLLTDPVKFNEPAVQRLVSCGVSVREARPKDQLPRMPKVLQPSFFQQVTTLDATCHSLPSVIETFGYSIVQRVSEFDFPRRHGCQMILINNEKWWLDYSMLRAFIDNSELIKNWVCKKADDSLRPIDVRIEATSYIESLKGKSFKTADFQREGFGSIEVGDFIEADGAVIPEKSTEEGPDQVVSETGTIEISETNSLMQSLERTTPQLQKLEPTEDQSNLDGTPRPTTAEQTTNPISVEESVIDSDLDGEPIIEEDTKEVEKEPTDDEVPGDGQPIYTPELTHPFEVNQPSQSEETSQDSSGLDGQPKNDETIDTIQDLLSDLFEGGINYKPGGESSDKHDESKSQEKTSTVDQPTEDRITSIANSSEKSESEEKMGNTKETEKEVSDSSKEKEKTSIQQAEGEVKIGEEEEKENIESSKSMKNEKSVLQMKSNEGESSHPVDNADDGQEPSSVEESSHPVDNADDGQEPSSVEESSHPVDNADDGQEPSSVEEASHPVDNADDGQDPSSVEESSHPVDNADDGQEPSSVEESSHPVDNADDGQEPSSVEEASHPVDNADDGQDPSSVEESSHPVDNADDGQEPSSVEEASHPVDNADDGQEPSSVEESSHPVDNADDGQEPSSVEESSHPVDNADDGQEPSSVEESSHPVDNADDGQEPSSVEESSHPVDNADDGQEPSSVEEASHPVDNADDGQEPSSVEESSHPVDNADDGQEPSSVEEASHPVDNADDGQEPSSVEESSHPVDNADDGQDPSSVEESSHPVDNADDGQEPSSVEEASHPVDNADDGQEPSSVEESSHPVDNADDGQEPSSVEESSHPVDNADDGQEPSSVEEASHPVDNADDGQEPSSVEEASHPVDNADDGQEPSSR